ncbi:MAG: general nucleoside transport system permease protein [Eubacteriales bacterium SKADARSKE-1]|nr:general nucleoside transport system permease protein [Eubacteriales bacterium SKADARSKE-1]
MLNDILPILGTMLMYSAPLIFGALGGVVSERSGVINIGIEGMMTFGAFMGAAVGYYSGNPWIGFLAGGVAGALLSALHAIASISFNADQTISGIALNLIGPGLSLFLCRVMFSDQTVTYPVQNKLPKVFGSIDITVVIALVLTAFIWFILYKTKWGLRIRAVGEHPAAADTLGVNVYAIRYVSVILSGLLSGFGGAAMTLAVVSQFSPAAISGQGFMALAAVIFGKWTPFGAYGACLLFAFAQALTVNLGGVNFVPSEILNMLPYVLTIVILVLFVGKSVAPKADGVPYEKGMR